MLDPRFDIIKRPQTQYNLLETINFKLYQWLPRVLPYTPNPFFLNHISRQYNNIAWHSDFRVRFPHSIQYRMLKAITTSNFEQIKILLKHPGFKINEPIDKKYGFNALQYAALINQFTIIELLLMYGANINKKDQYGNTALIYAVDRHNLESINSLMKNGANRFQKNNYQIDAIGKSESKLNQQYLVDFLKNYPQTSRKFPKFKVKLKIQEKLNNPFWEYVKKYKIYNTKPKLFPFNNFKGTYRIDLCSYETVQKIIEKQKTQIKEKINPQKDKNKK